MSNSSSESIHVAAVVRTADVEAFVGKVELDVSPMGKSVVVSWAFEVGN
jgi:hypothetical protein